MYLNMLLNVTFHMKFFPHCYFSESPLNVTFSCTNYYLKHSMAHFKIGNFISNFTKRKI